MNFTDFNLNAALLKGLEDAGYETCTQVQEQVLKCSQDGSDLYVQSQTGTGKTAAYLVAIIQEILSKAENKGKKVLVLVPTRELAVQVEEEAKTLAKHAGLNAYSFYGGVGYEKQIAAIKKGLDIIVSTPGRLIDLVEGGNLELNQVAFVVLDEADRMFDMGFYPDLRKILKFVPKSEERQTMLFSATLNTYVKNLAWEYTRDPKEIEIEAENITVSEIDQELLHVSSDEKMKLLIGIIKNENPQSLIIFCNTKRSCEVVAKRLEINELKAGFIIGDLPQARRLKVLKDFKEGKLNILVATDVAARGIDVDDLAMVINYDLPNEAENYVHRIGRTARAGKSGKAYTFCSEQDVYNLPAIERFIEMQIPAKVAYPEQMMEDKSAGQYIKTENWHDDDEAPRGGHRSRDNYKGKGSKGGHRYEDKKDGYKKSSDKKNYDSKGKKGSKTDKKNFYSKEDFSKMESMSFDERMKFYKEKYGSSDKTSYFNGGKGKNSSGKSYTKDGRNSKTSGNFERRTAAAGSYGSYSKKNSKKDYSKNKNFKNNRYVQEEKPAEKKGFLAKIKAFFGR
ncbi:MAG: DEAD/DEAH box helicase [Treponema sp.]|nr:DEAD/DEAH box helicase [Treponema sp.]